MNRFAALLASIANDTQILSAETYRHPAVGDMTLLAVRGVTGERIDDPDEDPQRRIARGLTHFIYTYYHLRSAAEVNRLERVMDLRRTAVARDEA